MDEVGIITFQCANNYGAVLQCYALKRFCETELNKKVSIINYTPRHLEGLYRFFDNYYFACWRTNKILFLKLTVAYLLAAKSKCKKINLFNQFRKNHLGMSGARLDSSEKVKNAIRDYETVVLGSDQIWNPMFEMGFDDVYFGKMELSFPRFVSYAASVGIDAQTLISINWRERCSALEKIGVREEQFCQVLLQQGVTAQVNIDPVFLVPANEWKKNSSSNCIRKNYLFLYVMEHNDDLDEIVLDIKRKLQLEVVELLVNKKNVASDISIDSVYPFEFVRLISDATMVITNSFHATAFSIIMKKDFYVYPHSKRSERMTDILKKFDLSDRMIQTMLQHYTRINYDEIDVDQIIGEERVKAKDFLKII